MIILVGDTMNETIGVKGGRNDRKRTLKILEKEKQKLKQYEEEKEIKELENNVKKKQFISLIKILPISFIGGTIKTFLDNSKKDTSYEINKNNDNRVKESFDNSGKNKERKLIDKQKVIILPSGEKVTINIPNKNNTIKESSSTNSNTQEELTQKEKKTSETIFELTDNSKNNVLTDYNAINIDNNLEKVKSHKLVDAYETKLKDIRYDLRHLVYEYNVLVSDSNNIVLSKEAEIILDKLSDVIDKLDVLKSKIKIDDIDKYDDNYIYYIIKEYLNEFNDGKTISNIKDSPLYIEISKKIVELDRKRYDLNKKVNDKKAQLEEKETKFAEFKNKYYDLDKINNDLLSFQYEQDLLLKELEDKVANATTITERVEYETQVMSKQSRLLINLLSLQLFLPGPRSAKKMAAGTAAYLYFLNNVLKPKKIAKRYKVIRVKDYHEEIEDSLASINDASDLLYKTSSQVDMMIDKLSKEFKDYLGVIPEADELLYNLNKIKSELNEKEYEMDKLKKEQKKVLEDNNVKVLTRGDYQM